MSLETEIILKLLFEIVMNPQDLIQDILTFEHMFEIRWNKLSMSTVNT